MIVGVGVRLGLMMGGSDFLGVLLALLLLGSILGGDLTETSSSLLSLSELLLLDDIRWALNRAMKAWASGACFSVGTSSFLGFRNLVGSLGSRQYRFLSEIQRWRGLFLVTPSGGSGK